MPNLWQLITSLVYVVLHRISPSLQSDPWLYPSWWVDQRTSRYCLETQSVKNQGLGCSDVWTIYPWGTPGIETGIREATTLHNGKALQSWGSNHSYRYLGSPEYVRPPKVELMQKILNSICLNVYIHSTYFIIDSNMEQICTILILQKIKHIHFLYHTVIFVSDWSYAGGGAQAARRAAVADFEQEMVGFCSRHILSHCHIIFCL